MPERLPPRFLGFVAAFAALLFTAPRVAFAGLVDPCAWTEGLSFADLNGTVRTLAVFDDGTGPALYAGGIFTAAGGERASRVARWDGAAWSALGLPGAEGVGGSVNALAVFDDGTGPALYVAGFFTAAGGAPANNVARWDGAAWSTLGSGATNGVSAAVAALEVYDDGGGEALYLGGDFLTAGGTAVNRIAKWDGAAFSALTSMGGTGLESRVRALATYAGSLVAAGDFQNAGGTLVKGIASWSGSAWSALPGPTDVGLDGTPHRLRVFDLGGGPELFVAGDLFTAGGLAVGDVARWNGTTWSTMGNIPVNAESIEAYDLALFDPGTGPALYVGGFSFLEDEPFKGFVARWTGAGWSVVAQPEGFYFGLGVRALLTHDEGLGQRLYVGGDIARVSDVAVNFLGRYDGAAWSRLSSAPPVGLDGDIFDFASFDDGSGPKLYAAGGFSVAGPVVANHVARWNGTTWEALPGPSGVGTDFEALALAVFDDGRGPQLYVGGRFEEAGGIPVESIARWDGDSWSAVPGLAGIVVFDVTALGVFDDGSGARLYAGGHFSIGGQSDSVLQWDGATWSRLTGPSGTGTNLDVSAFEVFDDGSGAALYLGGSFTSAGGMAAQGMARWDGAAWSSMPGVAGGVSVGVTDLAVFSDAKGPALYAGGSFETAGGVTVNNIARFRQGAWSALPVAGGPGLPGRVNELTVLTGAAQPYLVATGNFPIVDGQTVNKIARWNGTAWSPLAGPSGTGLAGPTDFSSQASVNALFAFDDGPGPGVFVAGEFAFAGGLPSGRVGRYVCPLLFADGFETGDTSAWTRTFP